MMIISATIQPIRTTPAPSAQTFALAAPRQLSCAPINIGTPTKATSALAAMVGL